MQREFESLIRVEFEATRAAADLRYFDEARTVAVFMAAHTADLLLGFDRGFFGTMQSSDSSCLPTDGHTGYVGLIG